MAKHAEQRFLPYSPAQMYDLVADVDKYPEFLPWCVGARVRKRQGNEILADLMIGFAIYRERFTSKVTLAPPDEIRTEYTEGPFRYLQNRWRFIEQDGGCVIDFYVEFEFKSKILQKVIAGFFEEAVRRMVAAFEARARTLYGPPASNTVSAS
ncbi:MAG TPA: type II toxin-antitoxin system RatA family toxin [Stellaceae bacterium]|nr:type II toxin-antitoxin system RatA family toxin [Stellaceae bacterium]